MPRTHDMTNSPEYIAYKDAKRRCENSSHSRWKDYGGRGIKFLFLSFEQFFEEVGKRPKGRSLDRKDNEGNYEPGNVRWATKVQQQNNKRRRTVSNSNTGFIGVYRRKNNGKFAVRLLTQGKRLHLGNFNTIEEAVKSRDNEIQKQENTHVRCLKFYEDPEINRRFLNAIDSYQASSKVVEDETTEQVFSRKDRKAYRAEILRQRTEASSGNSKRKAGTLGEKGKACRKGTRS